MSYGIDQIDNYQLAASYADRFLKGTKPSELPRHPANSNWSSISNLQMHSDSPCRVRSSPAPTRWFN